jgi:hypothetical protein
MWQMPMKEETEQLATEINFRDQRVYLEYTKLATKNINKKSRGCQILQIPRQRNDYVGMVMSNE